MPPGDGRIPEHYDTYDEGGNMRIAKLHPDGSITDEVELDPSRCPSFIMVPEHYRADGSCRCDDITHVEMNEWGYTWGDGRWS